ncbi:amidohydrolase [Roseomonas sp. AR75]|uniref:amidohydrolase n=1 Tax=Roseomonas sp. AR75 TaxID=2562311 RepID=UPI001484F641|nr:amidohydrolase [Roseomonas sp. AR75]
MRRFLFVAALACAALPALAQQADMLLRNGRIHTVDAGFSTTSAVAIRDGRFVAVGQAAEAMAGPGTQVVDLGGRAAIPGLIDSHVHQHQWGMNLLAVPLLGARSIGDVVKAIGERARQTPPGEWVIASSLWHESILAEGRLPTRWELDAVSPDNPVFIPRGGHVVTLNSQALARAGITRDTPQPAGGVIVKREDGEPTGVLLIAGATSIARRALPPPPPAEEQAKLLVQAMAELNALGVTAVVEPGIFDAQAQIYARLRDEGRMTVRTWLLWRAANREQIARGIAAQQNWPQHEMLRSAGIKFLLDGGVEGARMNEPYRIVPGEQTNPNYRGILLLPAGGEAELLDGLRLIHRAGLPIQTHAVGDYTIDLITRLYGQVNDELGPVKPLRWTVMHIFLPTPDALATMSRLGIMATAQNHPVLLGHNQRRWWGDERAAYSIPIRRMLDAGVHVGGGTDAPVVPGEPFQSMWWMTTRGTLAGYRLGPEQAITVREALTLYTRNNAVLLGAEDELGSIEPGKRADLVVLSQDILAVEPDRLRDTRALMTLVGGRVVHRQGM